MFGFGVMGTPYGLRLALSFGPFMWAPGTGIVKGFIPFFISGGFMLGIGLPLAEWFMVMGVIFTVSAMLGKPPPSYHFGRGFHAKEHGNSVSVSNHAASYKPSLGYVAENKHVAVAQTQRELSAEFAPSWRKTLESGFNWSITSALTPAPRAQTPAQTSRFLPW